MARRPDTERRSKASILATLFLAWLVLCVIWIVGAFILAFPYAFIRSDDRLLIRSDDRLLLVEHCPLP